MTRKDATTAGLGGSSGVSDLGVFPVVPGPDKPPGAHAATGASAASMRALTSQAVAFYFRAPVKAFFRTRVDYLAYARALQEQQRRLSSSLHPSPTPPAGSRWHWFRQMLHRTTPGVLASAVRHEGWRVVPDQVLPPLVANVAVGAVLYTSYLQLLGTLHEPSSRATRRVYPSPPPRDVFAAGFLAGGLQSVVAAPLDAVQARYDAGTSAAGMTGSGGMTAVPNGGRLVANGAPVVPERPQSMWAFSYRKLREIGLRGIFAGWGLSFLKDSLGCAVFFTTFEWTKAQGYYGFVRWYYSALSDDVVALLSRKRPLGKDQQQRAQDEAGGDRLPTIIRPHYAIEPAFLMLAGGGASVAQQVILHPLSHVQAEHWERLESLDAIIAQSNSRARGPESETPRTEGRWRTFRAYYQAYRNTWIACLAEAKASGLSMPRWLYRGFWWNTIRQVPGTSAGLIIFELVRRKYGLGGDEVRIQEDGYTIMLR